jgi:hypothetical protein
MNKWMQEVNKTIKTLKPEIAVILDVSGSIPNGFYKRVFPWLDKMCEYVDIKFIQWDTKCLECSRYIKGYRPKLFQGDGTDLMVGIKEAYALGVQHVFVFTDEDSGLENNWCSGFISEVVTICAPVNRDLKLKSCPYRFKIVNFNGIRPKCNQVVQKKKAAKKPTEKNTSNFVDGWTKVIKNL